MGFASILLIFTLPFIIGSQASDTEDQSTSLQEIQTAPEPIILNPYQFPDKELPISSGLKVEDLLNLLTQKYKEKLQIQKEPRMFLGEFTERNVAETCATYSSLECGEKVLKVLSGDDSVSIRKKCKVRKEFLECIDIQRRTCKELFENKLVPILPSKKLIRETQEKVWRALWTSGACTLAI